jgi:hypothetical protein
MRLIAKKYEKKFDGVRYYYADDVDRVIQDLLTIMKNLRNPKKIPDLVQKMAMKAIDEDAKNHPDWSKGV